MKKSGLGKGLQALFEENSEIERDSFLLNLNLIEVNKDQPRKNFKDETLSFLAESIKQNGVIQPILVRKISEDRYQIVAGERRFRAAKMVGLKEIPVIVKKIDEDKVTEIALVENLQREDLNPIEEAKGFLTLVEKHGLTQDEVSKKVGKSRSFVTNSIRLLNLPNVVKEEIKNGNLTSGQARTLLAIKNEEELIKLAKLVIKNGMSVREIERIVSLKKERKECLKKEIKDHIFKELEKNMQEKLKRKVKIKITAGEKGRLTIDFYNRDELISMAYSLEGLKK